MNDINLKLTTVLTQIDAAATIIFLSRKIRHTFEGGYHSRYVYACIIVRIQCYSVKNMASQGKWTKHFASTALCADTMSARWCGHHFWGDPDCYPRAQERP